MLVLKVTFEGTVRVRVTPEQAARYAEAEKTVREAGEANETIGSNETDRAEAMAVDELEQVVHALLAGAEIALPLDAELRYHALEDGTPDGLPMYPRPRDGARPRPDAEKAAEEIVASRPDLVGREVRVHHDTVIEGPFEKVARQLGYSVPPGRCPSPRPLRITIERSDFEPLGEPSFEPLDKAPRPKANGWIRADKEIEIGNPDSDIVEARDWFWRDENGKIRRAYGYLGGSYQRAHTWDANGRCVSAVEARDERAVPAEDLNDPAGVHPKWRSVVETYPIDFPDEAPQHELDAMRRSEGNGS